MQTHPWEPWDLLQVLGEGGRWLSGFHVVRRYYAAIAALERGALSREEALAVSRLLAETPGRATSPDGLPLQPPEEADAFAQAIRFLSRDARTKAAGWLRACSPLSRRMHRNTRSTLRRYHQMGLLERPPATRDVREVPFDFATAEEREVYEAVETYIDRRFAELETQKPGKGFVMTIYRRRAASSPLALRKSLERRAQGLRAVVAQRAYDDTVLDLDDAAELEDLLNAKLTSAFPDDSAEAVAELRQVETLVEKIDALGALDTKRDLAVAQAKKLTADGRSVLIFTGYADTMAYLREALIAAYGDAIGSYSGDGGAIRARGGWISTSKEGVAGALRASKIRVLACTDAASEGLNLQAAGALINYDLPWNPSKVEQRIGRIDRIGQVLPVLPVVNLYLKDSVDQKVYRALANRCGLFETFVGPMQPVLSRALRMLLGRVAFDEDDLAREAERLRNDPTVMHAFPDADPVDITHELPLVSAAETETLIDALDGTGVDVRAETNGLHLIAGGPLRIASHPAAVLDHPEATCVDGLDQRQWALLAQLQRPGDRLPLICAPAVEGAFRAWLCAWVDDQGASEIRFLSDLRLRLDAWGGKEPPAAAWQGAAKTLRERARAVVARAAERARYEQEAMMARQHEAARLRLIEELGRFLMCFQPDTPDLNGKLYRLASDQTATASRLREVLQRLGDYPDWPAHHVAELRSFRDGLSANQIKTRLTGRELEAALADPRWSVANCVEPTESPAEFAATLGVG